MSEDRIPMASIGRRAFISGGTLLLASPTFLADGLLGAEIEPSLRMGLVTDLHYADKPPAGTRHYRESLDKLAEAAREFSTQKVDMLVELGDFIDAADSVETELGYLKRIDDDFSKICKQRHYVLGNHCVATLTKQEFLETVEQERSFYSLDAGAFHFVVLDACFRADGAPYGRNNSQWNDANIPPEEVEWLRADMQASKLPTIVLAHQRLDVGQPYGIKNAPAIRSILEESGRVLAVLQGHSHKNDYHEIGGIHYCTLVAMVEGTGVSNNGFSVLNLAQDGTIQITGFRKQHAYQW